MHQQGKPHAGSFYDFNFLCTVSVPSQNDVIKSNVRRGKQN